MTPSTEELLELTREIFTTLLEISVERDEDADLPEATVTACIQIAGDWEGSLILRADERFAREASGKMFSSDPDAVTSDEIVDAVGEIVNVLGGSFKALLGGDNRLSLPTVTLGQGHRLAVRGATLERELLLSCGDGNAFRVQIYVQPAN